MRRSGFCAMALAAAVSIGCDAPDRTEPEGAAGTSTAVGTGGEAANVSGADRDFVRELAIASQAEIELGRMATEKGMNAEVKKFGQMMVDDHSKGRESLTALAARH